MQSITDHKTMAKALRTDLATHDLPCQYIRTQNNGYFINGKHYNTLSSNLGLKLWGALVDEMVEMLKFSVLEVPTGG